MEIKTLEIRDKGTFIPMVAIRPSPRNESERYLWARAGYGINSQAQANHVLFSRIDGSIPRGLSGTPYDWADRTITVAHMYIRDNWDSIENGQVIDVEFILGETIGPKESERNADYEVVDICPTEVKT